MNISLKMFHKACEKGDLDSVKSFISSNSEAIDITSKGGWTGLIIACYHEKKEVVNLLIELGANVNAVNNNGTTVFMYAKTPIQNTHKDTSLLTILLKNGAEINKKDLFGKTVLDYVIENNDLFLINWLISKGAKGKNIQNKKI